MPPRLSQHIDLDRRFAELDKADLDLDTVYALSSVWGVDRSLGWDDLLKSERVIVLADAGSGKTWEMRAQVARLRANGDAALFIPLQNLAAEGLRDCLTMETDDIALFDGWLADPARTCWLFLDAVDELKLTTTTLDLALGRVARDTGNARSRLRVVISCRPWDWRPVDDLETLMRRLPPLAPNQEELPTGEEAFLAPVREHRDKKNEKPIDLAPQVRIVVMMQLSQPQIKTFLGGQVIADADALLTEIIKQEALPFARRPLDLKRLSASWKARGTLGSRLQQHEDDVESALQDRTDRLDTKELPAADAIEGAERLALALALTKSRSLQDVDSVAESVDGQGVLSPADVFDSWPATKIAALLRRAIFDPATYGRVQFHHRSVQEFLAARRLFKLREANLSKAELFRLLFAETYGEKVLVPAMRPIAAWLAIWCEDVAREILRREPEVLVQLGDPASLRIEHRKALLHAVVDNYGGGGWRGLQFPYGELRRLANPDLADEIRACWERGATNDEVREFLIELIYLGSITACADIVRDVALDVSASSTARVWAIRAIEACGQTNTLCEVAARMIDTPALWDDRIIRITAPPLFPAFLSVADLITLVQRAKIPRSVTSGFGYSLLNNASEGEPLSAHLVQLRDGLAELIWAGLQPSEDRFNPVSTRGDLTEVLAVICQRQLTAGDSSPGLVRASVIAHRIGESPRSLREGMDGLRAAAVSRIDLHRAFALAELELSEEIAKVNEPWNLYYYAFLHGTLCRGFEHSAWDWLAEEAAQSKGMARGALLIAMADLWWTRGQVSAEQQQIIDLAEGDAGLIKALIFRTSPRKIDPNEAKWQKEDVARKRKRAANEKRIVASWRNWKEQTDADVPARFTPAETPKTINVGIQWLGMHNRDRDLAHENWREIRRHMGDAFGDAFESAMRAYWRNETPLLRSNPNRPANKLYHEQTIALTGLSIETAEAGWASQLSQAEAIRAAEWGTLQLNNLPEWYPALAAAWPSELRAVLLHEITRELATTATIQHPHTLSAVQHATTDVMSLLATDAEALIKSISALPDDPELHGHYAENIDRLLSIVATTTGISASLGDFCADRFLADVEAVPAVTWLRGAFKAGLDVGLRALTEGITRLKAERTEEVVTNWIAALFGDRYVRFPVRVKGHADDIFALTRLTYQYVRRSDDIDHDGVFTPGVRDDAQSGRNTLISALMDLPGKDAHRVLLAAAEDPLFDHMPDRLRLLARERAAKDSDLSVLTPAAFRAWENACAWPPQMPAELFTTMMDRLDDIQTDVRDHPFNIRHILVTLTKETDMQPVVAKELEDRANGTYAVTREEESADKKEPDIRLVTNTAAGKAVVEIKIGDNDYSVRDLEETIRIQLIGQYLRHHECTVGCLLVTFAGRKGFRHPVTGSAMSFEEVINHLKDHAAELERADSRDIRVGVAALDLRSPLTGKS